MVLIKPANIFEIYDTQAFGRICTPHSEPAITEFYYDDYYGPNLFHSNLITAAHVFSIFKYSVHINIIHVRRTLYQIGQCVASKYDFV